MSEPLTDIREMRKALRAAALRGDRIDGKPHSPSGLGISIASTLARNAYHAAQHAGWSGEDEMTLLAYHALRELEQSHDREARYLMTAPASALCAYVAAANKPTDKPAPAIREDFGDTRWLCLQCLSSVKGRHGVLADGKTPCPGGVAR